MSELVHLEVAAGVATITLDSPANRNALSAPLRTGLCDALTACHDDDAVRVVVLTHSGTVFCAGADLKETSQGSTLTSSGDAPGLPEILQQLALGPKPVVARLAGPARAGGMGLVACCDLVVCADTVTFAFTEVRIGVVPAIISVPLKARVAPAALHELFLTGETFDAARAREIGIVSSAVSADGLDAEVTRYTDMLARGGPGALAGSKRLLGERLGDFAGDLARAGELSAGFFGSDEAREGMSSFLQQRPAAWVPQG